MRALPDSAPSPKKRAIPIALQRFSFTNRNRTASHYPCHPCCVCHARVISNSVSQFPLQFFPLTIPCPPLFARTALHCLHSFGWRGHAAGSQQLRQADVEVACYALQRARWVLTMT